MSTDRRVPEKRRLSVSSGFGSLKSFKVPKKTLDKSLLEAVNIESSDFVDEILSQVQQSCRFPLLTSHLQVKQAWLVHNRTLEESFTSARKRLHKSGTNASGDSSLGLGFYAAFDWSTVEDIANNGLHPGNEPNTWLGKPEQGVVVNQCADLTVARAQHRLIGRAALAAATADSETAGESPPSATGGSFYLVLLRWVKSRAYIVSMEAEESDELLEPQPGYTCHVSTWSRIDPLDPTKLSLERAFQMAQVYLYEFDEELELRPKPEHILPYAVVRCRWTLDSTITTTASGEALTAATGSILALTVKPARILSGGRHALLPTPPKSVYASRSAHSEDGVPSRSVNRLLQLGGDNAVPLMPSSGKLRHPRLTIPRNPSHRNLSSPPLPTNPTQTDRLSEDKVTPMHSAILQARRLVAQPELVSRLGEPHTSCIGGSTAVAAVTSYSSVPPGTPAIPGSQLILVGTSLVTWGQPDPELYSLQMELYVYRRSCLPVFDGLFQPCLHVSRLVSHISLHYELAGLTPRASKSLEPGGPPVLVSVPRDQEWCLPRLNESTAASLQCDPSPFAGYRGNYVRLLLPSGGRRAEMSQFCEALREKSMAAVIPIPCDESSTLFLFPDCQFSRSINLSSTVSKPANSDVDRFLSRLLSSFPPNDGLDTNYLHGILLTPYSLDRYPYDRVVCSSLTDDSQQTKNMPADQLDQGMLELGERKPFIQACPVSAPSELLHLNKRNSVANLSTQVKAKIPLDALLSALPDGGKELLGTAFIAILAAQRDTESAEPRPIQSPSASNDSPQQRTAATGPRMDPRLRTARAIDTQALADSLLSSIAQKTHVFSKPAPVCTVPDTTTDRLTAPVVTQVLSAVKSECEVTSSESALDAPTSPPAGLDASELDSKAPPMEPKEIPLENGLPPLSCSSPTAIDERSFVPCHVTTESLDMEIESHHPSQNVTGQSVSNSSDMEIETPSFNYQSPFKIRYQPYTPSTPESLPRLLGPFNDSVSHNSPQHHRPRFTEPPPPVCWQSPGAYRDLVRGHSPHSRTDFARRALFDERSNEDRDNRFDNAPEKLPREDHTGASFPIRDRSPHGFSPLSHSTIPPMNRTDDTNRGPSDQFSRYQINASPVLMLEDVTKTHPYYFRSPDRPVPPYESEEGEIVDDDNELDESEDGVIPGAATAPYSKKVKRHSSDGPYSSFSSDFSSNASLSIVDEWHNPSCDNSSSRSYSSSSRNSPRRRSSNRRRRASPHFNSSPSRVETGVIGPERRNHYSDVDQDYHPPHQPPRRRPSFENVSSSESLLRLDKSIRSSENLFTNPRNRTPEAPFKRAEQTPYSAENSDHSLWDTETSLEDEDMRIQPTVVSRHDKRMFYTDTHASHGTVSLSYSVDVRANPTGHTHVFSNKDVDYRHLPPEPASIAPRQTHRDHASSSRLPMSDRSRTQLADPLPRYSVYHPKSVDRDHSDTDRDLSVRSRCDLIVDRKEQSCSSGAVARHRSSSSRDSHRHPRTDRPRSRVSYNPSSRDVDQPDPKRRNSSYRDPPLLPTPIPTLITSRGLLPPATHPMIPFPGPFVPANFWSGPHGLNLTSSNQLQPPPQTWK